MATIHGKLLSLFESRGERYAFGLQREAGGIREVSSRAYAETTLRFSAYLKSCRIGRGDRVLLLSENAPEWTMAALAAMNTGAVVVPVASIASVLEITNTIKSAAPKLCLLSSRLSSARLVEEFLSSERIPYLLWDLQTEEPLGQWTKNHSPLALDDGDRTEENALLIYTSGTTGNPKGVPITHGAVMFVAEKSLTVVKDGTDPERFVGVLPLSHMFEFTAGFVTPSLIGAPVTYVKSLKAEDLLAALQWARATVMVGVPLLFEVLARNLQGKLDDLPGPLPKLFASFGDLTRRHPRLGPWLFRPVHKALGGHLRFFLAGGSKLQPATFEFFRGLGIPVLQGYGLTETAPVLAVNGVRNAGPDHVGEPLPGVDLGIFNDQGERLPTGEEGEIWAKGPNIFKGYLDPEHNQGVFFNGWFRTGDLGRLDAKNILRITGRKRDIIVTAAGKNVYPEEIETTVMNTALFLEVAVLGTQDAAGHEKITLVLVPDRPKFPGSSPEEIRRKAADAASEACRSLAEYKWPQRLEVLFEELPKTSTRKVKKHEVKKLLAARDAAAANGAAEVAGGAGTLNPGDELERTIGQGIESISQIPFASIRVTDSLTKDLGLDSLTFVELVSHVEKKFGTRIEGIDFAAIQTVRDLITALEFAAQSKRKKPLFDKVFFTDFPPEANAKVLWRLPRRLLNVWLRSYLRIRHGLEVSGIEHLREGGPFVFTPNHSSHMDLISLAGSVPGPMVHSTFAVAAKDYFFNRTWKALAARIFVNAIPFDRKGRVNESMQRCREALDQGGSLVIFPEGTRSPKGELLDFKPGVAQLLAGNGKARAVPVYIDGAYRIMPKGSKFPGPGKLRIRFGKPISFAGTAPDAAGLRQISERLRAEVMALGEATRRT